MKLMELLKNSLLIIAFGLFMFLSAEFALRVYMLGPSGLNPWMMNSYVIIFRSGLVKTADNTHALLKVLDPGQDHLKVVLKCDNYQLGIRSKKKWNYLGDLELDWEIKAGNWNEFWDNAEKGARIEVIFHKPPVPAAKVETIPTEQDPEEK